MVQTKRIIEKKMGGPEFDGTNGLEILNLINILKPNG